MSRRQLGRSCLSASFPHKDRGNFASSHEHTSADAVFAGKSAGSLAAMNNSVALMLVEISLFPAPSTDSARQPKLLQCSLVLLQHQQPRLASHRHDPPDPSISPAEVPCILPSNFATGQIPSEIIVSARREVLLQCYKRRSLRPDMEGFHCRTVSVKCRQWWGYVELWRVSSASLQQIFSSIENIFIDTF
jgi:hypothetical protein